MRARPPARILAVAAVYKQSCKESQTLNSLLKVLEDDSELAEHFSLLIYDNSPEPNEPPSDFKVHYIHDAANSGLAAAYNCALHHAQASQLDWLLLLDQDTRLTEEFIRELVTCALSMRDETQVVAIVPKLLVRGVIQSPAEHFIDYIRHQFNRAPHGLEQAFGVQRCRITAYNSGSTLRVEAIKTIGGFPLEFWLDYLDHAVFHLLCSRGGQVYIMQAALIHDLAESNLNARPLWRFRNVLRAQSLFVQRAGNLLDRLLYRVWLLRGVRRLRASVTDKRVWRETLWQAIRFRTMESLTPVRPRLDCVDRD